MKKHNSSHQNHGWETRLECCFKFSWLNFNIRKPWIMRIHSSVPQCDPLAHLEGDTCKSHLAASMDEGTRSFSSHPLFLSLSQNFPSLSSCVFCRRSLVSLVHSANIFWTLSGASLSSKCDLRHIEEEFDHGSKENPDDEKEKRKHRKGLEQRLEQN